MNDPAVTRTPVPAVEGLFTMDFDEPHLIGGVARNRGSYFFPAKLAGSDPGTSGEEISEVLLSRRGKLWSYTTSEYPPPAPYVITSEPFEPFLVAAVQLAEEQLVVLGQVADGVRVDDLSVGMEMELVLDVLYSDEEHDYIVWKWAPAGNGAAPDTAGDS